MEIQTFYPILMVLAGMLAGVMSSFFGIGGGSLIVPFLVSLFPEMNFESVVATSLAAIFINAIIIVYKSYRLNDRLTPKTFLSIGLPAMFGAIGGSFILPLIGSTWPKRLFVFILVITIIRSLIPSKNISEKTEQDTTLIKYTIIGFIGGVISSLTGLGGGVIMIPMMMFLTNLNFKRHSIISQAGMIFSTFAGVITHSMASTYEFEYFLPWSIVGRIHWGIVILLQVGSFMTTSWGLKQNQKVAPKTKKMLLVILFSILGSKIFISTL